MHPLIAKRAVKRGFDFSDAYEQAHYDLLIQTYTELKEMSEYQNVRLSKCYGRSVKGKGKTIFGMSVILAEKKQDELLDLLRKSKI
jgi:hypothetical protein